MPVADPSPRDPRMKRTRRLLQDGLRNLLRQKPLEEILVQDITDAATVNRATFYDHYSDKFDLFNALIAADFQELLQERSVCLEEPCFSGLAAIMLAVGDYLERLHQDQAACTRQASSGPLIDAAVTLAIRRVVVEGLEKRVGSSIPSEVVASLASGAIYGAVKESLSRKNWQADESALLALVHFILPILEQRAASSPAAVAPVRKRSRGASKSAK